MRERGLQQPTTRWKESLTARSRLVLILVLILTFPTPSIRATCEMPQPAYPGRDINSRPSEDDGRNPYPGTLPTPDPEGPSAEMPPNPESPGPAPSAPSSRPGSGSDGNGSDGDGGAGPRGGISGGRPSPGRQGSGRKLSMSWYLWWELNRENLLGFHSVVRGRAAVLDDVDPVAAYRKGIRKSLREFIGKPVSEKVKASVLRALGRAGTDEDARLFLALIEAKGTSSTVKDGAAIGLGLLPAIADAAIRDEVRGFAKRLTSGKTALKSRTRQLAIMALGLRARHDACLAAGLAAMTRRPVRDVNESAALLFALGLAREPILRREVTVAARDGKLAGRPQHDIARSHAVMALAVSGDPVAAVDVYSRILTGSEAQLHTRRSATIGMGVALRDPGVKETSRDAAERLLLRLLADDRDPLVSGFAAVSLGSSRKPNVIRTLIRTAKRGCGTVKGPFAILGLGLAARHLPDKPAKTIRRFLVAEYKSCRDLDRSGAFAIAAGIAGATEARDLLIRRLETTSAPLRVRALAAQALGMLGKRSSEVETALRKALDDGVPMVAENAAIALGILGHRETAGLLVKKLVKTRSKALQTHMMVALAHLGGTETIRLLMEILETTEHDDRVQVCGATVLGILADPRDVDAMFEIDAAVNAYGLTVASRNLVQPF